MKCNHHCYRLCIGLLAATTLIPSAGQAQQTPAPVYPVKVSANHRFLVDQNDTPFLIAGDSPQGLISRLTEQETDDFFADRQAKGFNTMGWVDVLCAGRDFITNIYATTPDGIRPFTGFLSGGTDHDHYDLSKPNEAYFTRLDHIHPTRGKAQHPRFHRPHRDRRLAHHAAQQRPQS